MERMVRGTSAQQPSFEEIFNLSLDLLCIGGLDGYFKRVNPAFEETFGYSSQELLSRPFLDFVHPEDRERSREAFEQLARGDEVVLFVNRNLRADGSTLWLEWSAQPAPDEQIFYGAGRDVTERKRSEQQLRQAQEMVVASRDDLRVLAEEQAALRRVAALVASEMSPGEVFATVAKEVGQLLDVENTLVYRYEGQDVATVVAAGGEGDLGVPIGTRVTLEGENVAAQVLETGRPAHLDDYANATGSIANLARNAGIRSGAGSPIVVEGRLWGALVALTRQAEPLPVETESRIGEFTQLVATAISNTEARAQLRRLAEEQAALRRVATLVARGALPTAVFDAVAAEAHRVLDADRTALLRYEPDATATQMARHGALDMQTQVGTRLSFEGENIISAVLRTGHSTWFEPQETSTGSIAALTREMGVRASVGAPIVVEGRLWGVLGASWTREEPPPADTEERLAQFAELAATAVANADSRAQLTASRARVLAAGDDARRRVVRDLHDGAQQGLVHAIVTLKLAQRKLRENEGSDSLVAEALVQAERANDELRELAHGILPSVLSRGGLRAGVDALVSRIDLPVTVDISDERFPPAIEASAYFVVAEALTNVVKHSGAELAEVRASAGDGVLQVEIRDDGVGGAIPDGAGLVGLDDRVSAIGGRLRVESPPEGGTLVAAGLPLPV
jgi:PAS domain S-box-containing protein